MAKPCAVCGKSLSILSARLDVSDGLVCKECWTNIGYNTTSDIPKARYTTVAEIKTIIDGQNESRKLGEYFSATKTIRDIEFDDNNKIFAVISYVGFKKKRDYFRYDQIDFFRLYEDGRNVTSANIGNAAIGGALFGSGGAVVGAMTNPRTESVCSSMYIKIHLKNCYIPSMDIDFITSDTERGSLTYSSSSAAAEATVKALEAAVAMVAPSKPERSARRESARQTSPFDDVRKYKQLLDEGIISEEEFQAKKKQLLGL